MLRGFKGKLAKKVIKKIFYTRGFVFSFLSHSRKFPTDVRHYDAIFYEQVSGIFLALNSYSNERNEMCVQKI